MSKFCPEEKALLVKGIVELPADSSISYFNSVSSSEYGCFSFRLGQLHEEDVFVREFEKILARRGVKLSQHSMSMIVKNTYKFKSEVVDMEARMPSAYIYTF